ncbi:heavy metal translocating P-type ATPase [Liquorilactobacillus mali]|uniref:heavy metal translocating P-type ATPase n=1 Tax=Liquorilactobacillus mali TaxID=1618 RepID=UPI0039EC5709
MKNDGKENSKMEHHNMSKMDHGETEHHDMSGMNHDEMKHHDMSEMNHDQMGHHDMQKMDHSQMGHDMSAGHMHHMGNFKQKFWISFVVALPIFILSSFMGIELPFDLSFPGSDWLVLLLGTFLFFYGGQPFYTGAWQEIKEKSPAMMTLITLGISVAYIYSLYAFIMNHFITGVPHVMDFFWELASLIVIMLLGHWIEMNATMNAGNALEKMAALLPGEAHVTEGGKMFDVPLSKLKEGQKVRVLAGEKIPADGEILEGVSSVNESLVTGESKAILKKEKDKVIGGSLNGDGTLLVAVTGIGENSYLAQVGRLVEQAQKDKSKAESIADSVSKWLFYAALLIGIIAFLAWLNLADMSTALNRAVAVLVIACPHALGLAIPLVVSRSTSLAAAHGLLIRNRTALEQVKHLDVILMDKTGTLTEGVFKVNEVKSLHSNYSDNEVLGLMAQLEANSNHPLAAGILAEMRNRKLKTGSASNAQTVKGVGITGTIDGHEYSIVTADYLRRNNIEFNQTQFTTLAQKGNSISYLISSSKKILGFVAQGDEVKPESKAFITELHKLGIEPVMLTGDNELAAHKVAQQLGEIIVKANLKPEDKEKIVRQYQNEGHHVMMIGDGVNDAPSLMRADIGVAIGAGTDVAIDSADVILVKSNPMDVLDFLYLAKVTNRKMVENLWWGAGYNIVALPLAAGLLAGIGLILSPAVGAIVMSLSTIIVALNAMTLKLEVSD